MDEEIKSRSQKKKKKKAINPIVLGILLLLIFTLGAAGGYVLISGQFDGPGEEGIDIIPTKKKLDPINILVVGCDQRGDEPSRADVIMVARLRPEQQEVSILSIPRDTRVPIEGRKHQEKINHALAYGDIPLLTTTVENFTGLEMDYYVQTNFEGFANIIDILGGVTIEVEKNMKYKAENIDLKAGLQTLNGHDALGYVRFRHDPMGDIGRVERQQKFINALVVELKDMSLSEALKIGKEAMNQIKTDMPASVMSKYAKDFLNISQEKVHTYTVPGAPDYIGGVSYWLADEKAMTTMLDEFVNGVPEPEPTPETVDGEEESTN